MTSRASAPKRVAALMTCLVALALSFSAASSLQAQTTPPTADSGLLAPPDSTAIRGESWPSLSPDGKTLCFTYLGDLWTVPAEGGSATRLTVHEGLDASSRWSPDGKWIAFSSLRNGNADVYIIPAQGGAARQVTFHSANDWLNDWSPDGTKLLFYSIRDTRNWALYSIDLRTRALKRLTNGEDEDAVRYGAWSPDGHTVAYTHAGQPWWRPWYRGSVAAHTVLEDVDTGKVRTLVKTPGQQLWPQFSPDGKSVFVAMIYGNSNTPNLWRVPVGGGEPRPVTRYTTDAVRYPSIAHNGSLIAYLWDGGLYTVKPDGTEPKRLSIIAHSDDKVNNEERQVLTQGATESEISPDGKHLALVIRGDIWLVPVSGGDAKRLTDDPANDGDITWSPDGTKLVLVSDRGNQPDIYTLDVKTKALTRLTNDPDTESNPMWSPDGRTISFAKSGAHPGLYLVPSAGGEERKLADGNGNNNFGIGINSYAWSPDSRWIAFSRMDRYENRDIWVIPAVGGTAINITRYPGENAAPKFTKDGRRLLFVSDRNNIPLVFQIPLEQSTDDEDKDRGKDKDEDSKPAPRPDRSKDVKIDFDDIHLRARPVTPALGVVEDYDPTPDSQRIVVRIGNNFWVGPIAGGIAQQLTSNGEPGGNIRVLADGSRFFYLGPNGTPRSIAISGGPPSVVAFSAATVFDRRALYHQAFNEFYRRFGTAFYDAKLHGVNWKALHDKYEPLLQSVATPEEFANLLSEMVGEVNSSHSEIGAASHLGGPQTATLGLYFDDSYTGPGLKVTSVMPKSPADKPETRILPGEYVLSVDGTDVAMTENYYQTLQDKAGKSVDVLVNSRPSKEGARTLKLKPISSTAWRALDYEARIRRLRERVEKLSSGRLAYIHVQNMDEESLRRFERELWGDAMNKDGLILDIRGNGGGNTHDAILQALSRRIYGYEQPRDGLRQSQPVRAWTKPVILLIDQNSYSDAEIFPAGFRSLKIGKIVGVPTPGYVIGTYESRLADGTTYRMPSWGWYTAEGKNMENLGIPPDIYVENTPEDIANGRDRQLEVAVLTALKEIPTRPDLAKSEADNTYNVVTSANTNPNGGSSVGKPRGGKQ